MPYTSDPKYVIQVIKRHLKSWFEYARHSHAELDRAQRNLHFIDWVERQSYSRSRIQEDVWQEYHDLGRIKDLFSFTSHRLNPDPHVLKTWNKALKVLESANTVERFRQIAADLEELFMHNNSDVTLRQSRQDVAYTERTISELQRALKDVQRGEYSGMLNGSTFWVDYFKDEYDLDQDYKEELISDFWV